MTVQINSGHKKSAEALYLKGIGDDSMSSSRGLLIGFRFNKKVMILLSKTSKVTFTAKP
jgi:hypothetical protein